MDIIIPRKFKVNHTTVELKNSILGNIIKFDNKKKMFKDSASNAKILVEGNSTLEIKYKILEIYNKGIENKSSLSPEELSIFHLVKSVKYNNIKDRVFIIGYKKNYISDINSTINKFRASTDYIEIDRNIELYNEEEFEKLYKSIIYKLKGKYHKFVIDLTNLYLNTDYSNTKKLISYIESINGKMLFLLPKSDFSRERFEKIFGYEYINYTVEKHRLIFVEDNLFVLDKVRDILNLSLKD